MENASVIATENILVLFAIVLMTGMVCGKLSKLLKIPDVVLYLLGGIIIGPALLNWISVAGYPVGNQLILTFGSAFILYDGGREIKLKVLNRVKGSVISLATLGVFISTIFIGYAVSIVFKIPLLYGLLAGAVVASTDPATLVPIFKEVNLEDKIKQTVISESAFNDAAATIVVFALITVIESGKFSFIGNVEKMLLMVVWGIVVGGIIGIINSIFISNGRYGLFHEYASLVPIFAVAISFVIADKLGGSGYVATFVLGLICGNKKDFQLWIPEEDFIRQRHVRETLTLILRMAIFILLGTHVDFIALGKFWKQSLLIVFLLMAAARPLVVIICTAFDYQSAWTIKERLFLMWVRETGVIPAALSGMIVSMNIRYAGIVSSITFMTILITLLIQASTTRCVAAKLDLME